MLEWNKILEGVLSTSPLAGALGFAAWRLWLRNESKDRELQQIAKEKDAEIARLNEARLQDLRAILKQDD